ncbi:type IX secretion system protein PorD [Flavobacterium sp. 25HG05S-40]|uniref:type IX secretion system protein PorD n=1 Tax=Flavobacterium sp. 25HG05S-40 TaxID=3458682 RepID=UPI004043D590
MKKIVSFLLLLFVGVVQAQQLNCSVQINSDKIATTNNQIFKNLQTSITDFVNKTDWTGEEYKQHEKIDCSMVIIVNTYDSNQFSATLQVQSTRPIFNSTYASPVFNFNDNDFSFRYIEFENLQFNPNSFDSNLVSVLAYYSYMILGFDADTYSLMGGTKNYETAQQIMNVSQQSGYKGWSQSDNNQNRYFLVSDVLSGTFDAYREALYQYHREGLDLMSSDQKGAKEKVMVSVNTLTKIYKVRPNAFLTRVFFDAKVDELVSILSGGPRVSMTETIDALNKLSPLNVSKWSTIRL